MSNGRLGRRQLIRHDGSIGCRQPSEQHFIGCRQQSSGHRPVISKPKTTAHSAANQASCRHARTTIPSRSRRSPKPTCEPRQQHQANRQTESHTGKQGKKAPSATSDNHSYVVFEVFFSPCLSQSLAECSSRLQAGLSSRSSTAPFRTVPCPPGCLRRTLQSQSQILRRPRHVTWRSQTPRRTVPGKAARNAEPQAG